MGKTSGLFFRSNDPEAPTLWRRITPSKEQFEQQQERWNELADHLLDDLRRRSNCEIRTWLQGSYKFGTQVRPPNKFEEFDIDLGIYHCWDGQAQSGDHKPQDLKRFTHESLLLHAKVTPDVLEVLEPAKPRCSRIRYTGNFHIDVPSYHLDTNMDERTLAAEGGWEVSDPKAIYVWFKSKFDDARRAVTRRQIKYIKCWAALRWKIENGRPSSIMLTVLISDAISKLRDDDISADDDALVAVLSEISARLRRGSFIRNPVNPSENLNRLSEEHWKNFVEAIDEFAGLASDAGVASTQLEAADIWSRAFKYFFPLPVNSAIELAETIAKSGVPAIIQLPDVEVTAVSKTNSHVRFVKVNEIGPIPKNCEITFRIKNALQLQPGTTVHWVVRNEGGEAESENDLGHEGAVGLLAVETSSYAGTHFMDCSFRQSGRTYGVRRVPVTISGTSAPPRNPPRLPPYTSLRGRR